MMTRAGFFPGIALAILLLLLSGPVLLQAVEDEFIVYVPAFKSPDKLGQNVATILNMQVWQTFRIAPTPNPEGLDFGRGKVLWDTQTLPEQTHRSAEEAAQSYEVFAQFVLWGQAFEFKDGVVVQPFLSIPDYDDGRETSHEYWTIEVKTPQGRFKISTRSPGIGIPQRRYEFSPLLLAADFVDRYSVPNAFTIYDSRNLRRPVGNMASSSAFVATQIEGDLARITTLGENRIQGWIHLPQLSRNRSEVVDFVGGVVRVFRNDLHGAIALFSRVLDNPQTSAQLRADALLFTAMAREKLGTDGLTAAVKAHEMNPYYKPAVAYMIMCHLSRVGDHETGLGPKKEAVRAVQTLIGSKAYLFPKDDPWLLQVRQLVQAFN